MISLLPRRERCLSLLDGLDGNVLPHHLRGETIMTGTRFGVVSRILSALPPPLSHTHSIKWESGATISSHTFLLTKNIPVYSISRSQRRHENKNFAKVISPAHFVAVGFDSASYVDHGSHDTPFVPFHPPPNFVFLL